MLQRFKDLIRGPKLAIGRRVNFTVPRSFNGTRFRVPILGTIGARVRPGDEPWMYSTLALVAQHTTGAFVDVGANLGQTLLTARSVRADWRYVGFEPNPACAYYVNTLIEANDLRDCTLFPFGIGSQTGAADLRSTNVSGGEGTIVEGVLPDNRFPRSVKVPILGPDALPAELRDLSIGVLKVDVEDSELEVFQALEPLIVRDRPFIVTELLPVYGADSPGMQLRQDRQEQIVALLHQHRYRGYRIHRDGAFELIERIEPHARLAWSNYLFVPNEHESIVTGVGS